MADTPGGNQVERWLSVAATVVAPATLLSALLFYFGYVSARAQYEYFGIDVDTVGLSTRDYVMRSPQPLLVPLLVLALIAAGLLVLHNVLRGRAERAARGQHDGQLEAIAQVSMVAGLILLGAGLLLLFTYGYVRDWPYYNLATPLLVAAGVALTAYMARLRGLVLRRSAHQDNPSVTESRSPSRRSAGHEALLPLRRSVDVLIGVVVAASLFWATATVAQWSGRGLAQYDAQHLDRMPSVILDTKERLFLHSPGIEETVLPVSPDQTFHYRYRRLRLLIQGNNRMFLVPDAWSASNSTLVMPLDESVRVQFQFQNSPP